MFRRSFLLLASAAALAGAASANVTQVSGAERDRVLASLSEAVQSTRAVTGSFVQTNPDGSRVTGAYWLQRPGKVRFQYDDPSPLILVANGETVAVRDRALKTTDRFSQSATPLSLVLQPRINFARDTRVLRVERVSGQIAVTARDRRGEADGEITLVFDETSRAIREWTIRNGTGQNTRVVLTTQKSVPSIDPRAFEWRELIKTRPYQPPRA